MQSTQSSPIPMLLDRQNADGGWGGGEDLPSNSECTALACLALGAGDAAAGGRLASARAWLRARQRPGGAWHYDASGADTPWPTPLVLLALLAADGDTPVVRRGFEWLLAQRGRALPWRQRLREFLGGEQLVELDSTLEGWPWTSETFAWVEPTAWALAALKARWPLRRPRAVRRRIRDGERMLADRACTAGGWNYGNSRVMGADLDAFPDTTAVALIGLQGSDSPEVARGFGALSALLDENASTLSLALAVIASRAWRRSVEPLRRRLGDRLAGAETATDHRALALAALALAPRLDWLGRSAHA